MADFSLTTDDLYNLLGRKDAMILQFQREIESLKTEVEEIRASASNIKFVKGKPPKIPKRKK